MPFATCPECRSEQCVVRDMIGLAVPCRRCGTEFVASADGAVKRPPRRVRVVQAGEKRMTFFTVLMTIGLIAALVGVVSLAFVGIIWATRTPESDGPKAVAHAERKTAESRPATPVPSSPTILPSPPAITNPPPSPAPPREDRRSGSLDVEMQPRTPSDPPSTRPPQPPSDRPGTRLPQPTGPAIPSDDGVSKPPQQPRPNGPPDDGFPKPPVKAPPAPILPPKSDESPLGEDDKDDDETPPEVRAALKAARRQLASKVVSERVKGAEAIGELGPAAKSARRTLCRAMLDPSLKVRTAAADALKQVDRDIAEIAVAIVVNLDLGAVLKAGQMESEAEPLTPLVLALGTKQASGSDDGTLGICVSTLSQIAPEDEAANKFVVSMISSKTSQWVRHAAIIGVRGLKHRRLAVRPLMEIAKADVVGNRLAAIESLEHACHEDTVKDVLKLLKAMRFDTSPAIRKAVEETSERIQMTMKK